MPLNWNNWYYYFDYNFAYCLLLNCMTFLSAICFVSTKNFFNATLEKEERKKSEFDVRMDL